MKSQLKDGTFNQVQWNYDGFPFPKGDSYGVCNNFASAHFMNDDESECNQMARLDQDCDTLLNP